MKTLAFFLSAVASLIVALSASAADTGDTTTRVPGVVPDGRQGIGQRNLFDDTYQFIFFATLEGLYRDGVTSADVDALLATMGKDGGYLNFIYTCPICMPVEAAIATYKVRPRIDHLKIPNEQATHRTFGFGLPKETADALRAEKAGTRLGAVNGLVSKWISYRMDHSSFTEEQKTDLQETLKKGRERGMEALRGFAKQSNGPDSMKFFAAGYEGEGDECAICNAALQMPLKLKTPPEK